MWILNGTWREFKASKSKTWFSSCTCHGFKPWQVKFPYSTRILLQFNPEPWQQRC